MLLRHHLLQLVPNRVNAAIVRLQSLVWERTGTPLVEASQAGPDLLPFKTASRLPLKPLVAGSFWGKLFDQRWCRIRFPLTDGHTWLNWRDQGEATLYLNGEPYFGFDVAHRFCRLPAGIRDLWVESNCIQSAIWHPDAPGLSQGSWFEGAFLYRRNEKAWKALHDLKCLFEWAMDRRNRENPQVPTTLNGSGLQAPVDKFSPAYRRMLRLLDDSLNALDKKGLDAFDQKMRDTYHEFQGNGEFMKCVLTGHAHIDLVWLWPERMGELKAVHTFATVDRLMEEYPEFRFAYSQTASYEAVEKRSPNLYQKVLNRIHQGKWQATGSMYVESDTMMPCGEALMRSFQLGQEGFTRINGIPSRLAWLPDVFGYSACLPQIMKQMGVDYFFTTKMTWNAINRFPYSSFRWKGNDGSEVLAHVTQDCGYNSQVEVAEILSSMKGHQQGDIHGEYLMPNGFGDGGGGPTAEMCEKARRFSTLPGMPEMVWDQPEAFFDRLASLLEELPVHQGECYPEFHRGTFTTHGNLKETFRRLEKTLHLAEAVSSISGRRWDLETAWKKLVFAQFHDYIPGSSVWDVYVEGLPELEKQIQDQTEKSRKALSSERGKKTCLFNPHGLDIRRWWRHPETGRHVFISLPPLCGSVLTGAEVQEIPLPVRIDGRSVTNGLVEFQLNRSGWIDRLILNGQKVPLSGPAGRLMLYPDRAANCEAWDIDRHVLNLGTVCDEKAKMSPFNEGPHRAGFKIHRKIGKASEAVVLFSLESGSALLDITVELDWKEPEHLLKMIFPTEYAASHARFGAPFGSVLRPQLPVGLTAEAMWEVPFSRYLAVFDEGEREGLFLITESKYGAYVKKGEIGLSLVRSPRVPGFDNMPNAWPAKLSRLNVPSCSDLGKHRIRLALGNYSISLQRERQPAALAETHFSDPFEYEGKEIPSLLTGLSGGETLIPVWVQPLGKGEWVLRLHEVAGQRGHIKISVSDQWRMEKTDLSGNTKQKLVSGEMLHFLPYQILSLRVIPKKSPGRVTPFNIPAEEKPGSVNRLKPGNVNKIS